MKDPTVRHALPGFAAGPRNRRRYAARGPAGGADPRAAALDRPRAATWALPIAGVKAAPKFYTEAEYYATPVDEVRTYPVYLKSREPAGYRDWMRKQGPQPLIEPAKLKSEADWMAAGRDVFDGLHLAEFRTADPRAFRWADDPDLVAHEGVTVAADGTIPGVRWLIDHNRQLKLTLAECSGCHTRHSAGRLHHPRRAAQPPVGIAAAVQLRGARGIRRREGRTRPAHEVAYSNYGVPWLKDDINATLKTMTAEQVGRGGRQRAVPGHLRQVQRQPVVHDQDQRT